MNSPTRIRLLYSSYKTSRSCGGKILLDRFNLSTAVNEGGRYLFGIRSEDVYSSHKGRDRQVQAISSDSLDRAP